MVGKSYLTSMRLGSALTVAWFWGNAMLFTPRRCTSVST